MLFESLKSGKNLDDLKYKMTFGDYCQDNSQMCVSKNTNSWVKSLKFIKEPYAFLLGQTFKFILRKTKNFDKILNNKIEELKIDFDFPIVG